MNTPTDEDVLHYVDGNADEHTASRIETALKTDSELCNRVDAMRASRLPYSAAYKAHPAPPVPSSIRETVNRKVRYGLLQNQKSKSPCFRTIAIATAICLSFILGFSTSKITGDSTLPNIVQLDENSSDLAWVQRVADYQSLYVENTVDPTTVDRSKANKLLTTLSATSDLPTHIPDLTQFGYQFVRAQELGYDNIPLVQLVYVSPGKKPLALCFMPSEGQPRRALHLAQHEDLRSASWRLSNQRYVVVANESIGSLKAIARHVQKITL